MEKAGIDPTTIISLLSTSLPNIGQHNCGIFFIGDKVVKLISRLSPFTIESHLHSNKYALQINNDLLGFYPKYYTWDDSNVNYLLNISSDPDIIEYVRCIIMERLDDDLTNYILKSSYKNIKGDLILYDDFYDRLPKTHGKYIIDRSEEFTSFCKDISYNVKTITMQLVNKVIDLHHNIIRKGYEYYDLKMDNICYKTNDTNIDLYFIDAESGLSSIKNTSKFINYINLHGLIKPLFDYGVLGQYTLSNIFSIQFDREFILDDIDDIYKLIQLNNYKILPTGTYKDSRKYFKWIPFKINAKTDDYTDFYVIQILLNRYRLIYFDENGNHMSNPNFNKTKLFIDDIFDNLTCIFTHIEKTNNNQ